MISAVGHLFRLARAGFVFAREGVLGLVDPAPLPAPARLGLRIARLIERPTAAGAIGQALGRADAARADLRQARPVPRDPARCRRPRARARSGIAAGPHGAVPAGRSRSAVAAALGKPLREIYTSFGPAVAAASIAQVHQAPKPTGRRVAVKVLRPGIERRFKSDLDTLYFAARTAERHSAEARRLRMIEVVDTLARSVTIEMDLRLEAAAIAEIARQHEGRSGLPRAGGRLGAHRARRADARMDRRHGVHQPRRAGRARARPAGARARADADVPAPRAARRLLPCRHASGKSVRGCDGRIAAVDFGIMGRLTPKERRFLAEILYGFITRNYHRTAEVHFEAGYVPPHHSVESFAQAIRAIGEPIHNRTAADISMAKLLTLLFEVTGLFDMKTRPELLLLQKTMVVVEGVARSFDPNLDMWATAEPVVREWVERHLGPAGRLEDVAQGAGEVGKFLGGVPSLLGRAARSPISSMRRPATGWCWRPKPSRRSERPRHGAAVGRGSRYG